MSYKCQYQLKFKTMNMKQKIMRQREPENTKHRYQTEANNYDSTPTLNRLRDQPHHNKQNKNNSNYYQQPDNPKPHRFEAANSSEFTKRLKTTVNNSDFLHSREKKPEQAKDQIHSSQQFFRFRTKPSALRQQHGFISQQLTFAEVNQKKGLLTSREFMQEKKVKNQVIDEMIMNAKRGLCKSFNEFPTGFHCVNHSDKKAKYRLVSQLSEGEEQMFYCSKCAINLLQQSFKIQEVKAQDAQILNASRLQQITRLELKLKTLQNEAQLQLQGTNNKQELQMIKQQLMSVNGKFDMMVELLQKMQKQQIEYLHGLYVKKQNEQNLRRENMGDLMLELKNMQKEIVEYRQLKKFASMKENEFQFITASLANKITKFAENIPRIVKISPSRKLALNFLDQRQILDKLEDETTKRMQKQYTRRQREITFSRKSAVKAFQKSEDQFTCDELKRPFRVLFPSDEMEMGHSTQRYSDRNHMLQSVKQRPTFTQIE